MDRFSIQVIQLTYIQNNNELKHLTITPHQQNYNSVFPPLSYSEVKCKNEK